PTASSSSSAPARGIRSSTRDWISPEKVTARGVITRAGPSDTLTRMQIFLGSDHAGFELKGQLIDWLSENGHEPEACGPPAFDGDDDYPVYVIRAATSVIANPGSLGIVIGGAGDRGGDAAQQGPGMRAAAAGRAQA